MGVWPQQAPDAVETVVIRYHAGRPVEARALTKAGQFRHVP